MAIDYDEMIFHQPKSILFKQNPYKNMRGITCVRKVECYMQVLSRVTAIDLVCRFAKQNCYKIKEDEKLISQNDISNEYSILSLYENVNGALASQICIDFIQNPN